MLTKWETEKDENKFEGIIAQFIMVWKSDENEKFFFFHLILQFVVQ